VTTTAILLAGGSATRLSVGDNKVYLDLDGVPMLGWSLASLDRCDLVDDIVLVVRPEDRDRAAAIAGDLGVRKLRGMADGGDTRHASERAGLEAIAPAIEAGSVTLVAIHDAARPFIRQALLRRILTTAARDGGALPALPVDSEFLLRVDAGGAEPVDATRLRGVQTPQAFQAAALLRAYRQADESGFRGVDTAESVERFSDLRVSTVDGDPDNTKITFLEDLVLGQDRARGWDEPPRPRATTRA
jgi:2-C-methyl-D-erythritol 4-phosphate cytidylyltransferase